MGRGRRRKLDKREEGRMRGGSFLCHSDANTHLELKAVNRVDSS